VGLVSENPEQLDAAAVVLREGPTRSLAALALHMAGAEDEDIAAELGFTTAVQARTAWTAAIADTVTPGDVELVRRKESAALDALQSGVWTEATDRDATDQKGAIKVVLEIMKARRELLGLNRPTKVEVYSPTLVQIDEQITKLLVAAGLDADAEAEIVLDAVEVDDAG
jgi:hypothetical protein